MVMTATPSLPISSVTPAVAMAAEGKVKFSLGFLRADQGRREAARGAQESASKREQRVMALNING